MNKSFFRMIITVLALIAVVFSSRFAVSAEEPASGAAASQTGLTQSIDEQSPPEVYINGEQFMLSVPPAWRGQIPYVAMSEEIADCLGADFLAGKSTPLSAMIRRPGASVEFTDGLTRYTARGAAGILPSAPYVEAGYLMVPARELFEAFGYSVKIDIQNNSVRISLGVANVIIPQDFMDAVLTTAPAPAATGTKPVADGSAPKKEPDAGLVFTYENTTSFENVAISGASDQSNMVAATAFTNQFNLRLQNNLKNGYLFSSTIRTTETTEPLINKGRADKITATMEKGGISMGFFDIIPKYSYYTLKNYQIQGLQYERKHRGYAWTALYGKAPKKLADSEYSRFLQGFRIHRSMNKDKDFGLSFVRTRDAGAKQESAKIDNQVFALNAAGKYGTFTKYQVEYAFSTTKLNDNVSSNAKARTAQAQYRNKQLMCTALYDRTGNEFNSETTYFTAGRTETSTLCNKKLNNRTLVGTGYKSVLLGGENTKSLPMFFSTMPLKARKRMKLTLQKNFEKASSENGARITDIRSSGYADEFGKIKFDSNIERRKQKESDGAISFRDSQRYRLSTFISAKTEMSLQAKRERRTRGTNQRTRFSQLRFDHELKPWNDVSITTSRYYNGTANNRSDASVMYRKIDIENDTEMNIEFRHYNYREHNDSVIRVTYSFFK